MPIFITLDYYKNNKFLERIITLVVYTCVMIEKRFLSCELGEKGNNYEASSFILNTIKENRRKRGRRKILYACIGTPKLVGDSFGPMVGSILEEHLINISGCDSEVLGTVKNPLTAITLNDYREKLTSDEYFVIGIDSAISKSTKDSLMIKNYGFEPGIGIGNNNKENPLHVGDMSCLFVLGLNGTDYNKQEVFNRLSRVTTSELEEKAVFITKAILNAEMELLK